MTVINPSSISGITSITMPSGDGNVLTVHTNDGTERFRIDSSGNVKVGSACTISQDGDVFFTGVTTATTFTGAHSGSGANLTSLPAAQLTGSLPAISGANLTGIAATDNVRTGILDVAGIATFRNNVNVGTAVTITESGIEATGVGITVANINGTQVGGRKNIIINGAMQVSQRGTYFPNVDTNEITLDRFGLVHPYGDYFDVTQSTDSPDGFSKSYKLDINTVDSSIGSGQYVAIRHRIEAQNVRHFAFGTSSAKPITLSFYVRSNKTGTFAVNIQQVDNSYKQVSAPYTINSANTWERKTFTFAGDTSGVINADNGEGLVILWWLSAGSTYNSGTSRATFTAHADADSAVGCNVNILDNTSNNFYLTGVQLEVGSQATDFEHISFGEELQLCHRYYYRHREHSGSTVSVGLGQGWNTSEIDIPINFPTPMRTAPSLEQKSGSNYFQIEGGGETSAYVDGNWTLQFGTINGCNIYATPDTTITLGYAYHVTMRQSGAYLAFSAEL